MNIIAIGGGEKTPAVKHAIDLTGDEKPSVLLVPSAASTEQSYTRKTTLYQNYFHDLGITTSLLHEFNQDPSKERIAHELGRASLIYTFGGNSPYMLETMRRHGTDIALADAIRGGKIHAGLSSGALLPFELAHSNIAKKPAEQEWDFEYLETLGLIPGVATAHGDKHDETPYGDRPDSRHDALIATFPDSVDQGYAIDNGAALVINGDAPLSVIRSSEGANVYSIRRDSTGTITSEILDQ